MSENLIASLNAEVQRLQGELQKARGQAAKYRKRTQEVESKLTEKETDLTKHQKEVKSLQDKLQNLPDELKAENARLKSEIKTREIKEKFKGIAKTHKVRDEAVDDLFTLLNLKVESDLDDEVLTTALSEAVKGRPYLLAEEQQEKAAEVPTKLQPGPGLSKGSTRDALGFTATKEQMSDPIWSMKHRDQIQEASREGTLKISG